MFMLQDSSPSICVPKFFFFFRHVAVVKRLKLCVRTNWFLVMGLEAFETMCRERNAGADASRWKKIMCITGNKQYVTSQSTKTTCFNPPPTHSQLPSTSHSIHPTPPHVVSGSTHLQAPPTSLVYHCLFCQAMMRPTDFLWKLKQENCQVLN